MKSNLRAGGVALRLGLLACLSPLVACVADERAEERAAPQAVAAVSDVQPRHATYNCGQDGTITVENMRTAVRLVDGSGASFDLPAAPPSQTSRYGEGGLALVLEDREALWMKAGAEPVTCRR